MSKIAQNLARLKDRIGASCERVNRSPDEIKLIAITKTVSVSSIGEALGLGVTDIGENRVQEMVSKHGEIGDRVTWHMVGHLQTNKVKSIIGFCGLIHSVDSYKLAAEINRQAAKAGRNAEILIQTNVSGEATKWGVRRDEVARLIGDTATLGNIKVMGLMTIAPLTEKVEEIRTCFRNLRNLFKEVGDLEIEYGKDKVEMKYLSMGMTNDFEMAIEEGANLVRIGSAIFGPRR